MILFGNKQTNNPFLVPVVCNKYEKCLNHYEMTLDAGIIEAWAVFPVSLCIFCGHNASTVTSDLSLTIFKACDDSTTTKLYNQLDAVHSY